MLNNFIENAIREDIGNGDHTSLACIPQHATGKARLLVKENGILAGVSVAEKIFHQIDKQLSLQFFLSDGTQITKGDVAFAVEGNVRSILQAERLVLNVMQRMSGIATETRRYVDKLNGLKTKVVDTRKTTPGMRELEKAAVRIGGGDNHRMGLYDMILIKDNHIDYAGSIELAIGKTQQYLRENPELSHLRIEMEARNLDDVRRMLAIGGMHRIMLDNFTVENTRQAVQLIDGKYETESSGGITLETIRSYAECGVDFISVGALTHHIKSLDLSLKAV